MTQYFLCVIALGPSQLWEAGFVGSGTENQWQEDMASCGQASPGLASPQVLLYR